MESSAIVNLVTWAIASSAAFGAAGHAWSEIAASMLIDSLWQGAAIACGLALCMRFTPKMPARLRYGIWAAGFAALVCLPLLPSLMGQFARAGFALALAHPVGSGAGYAANPWSGGSPAGHALLSVDARWSLGLAVLWLAASLVRACGLAAHAVRMRRLWNSAQPVTGAAVSDSLLQNAAERSAELCVTSDLDRPCVIGFFPPRILIPAWLLSRLNPAELEQVVLHESEHLRRMDDWANLAQKLCLVVFPLNPALWWIERRLCAEREMACDDGVVRRTQAPRAYAACLAGLAERGLEHRAAALSLGAWQRRPELAARVHRLLRRPNVLNPAASAVSVGLVGCCLIAGTLALARSPRLVAFVAPAKEISLDADGGFAQATDGPGSTARPYRLVKTMAIVPNPRADVLPRINAAKMHTSSPSHADQAQQTGEWAGTGHSLASLVPEAVAARMRAQESFKYAAPQAVQTNAKLTDSTEAAAGRTSYLVLTTFEEVQTAGSGEDVQGDIVDREQSTHSSGGGVKTSTSITVTRLVLRLVQPDASTPAASNSEPAANTSPATNPQPTSNSSQPVVIPYRDGWFVIQL